MRIKTGKIAIIGFGREGKSLFNFLKKSKKFKGAIFTVLDRKQGKKYLGGLEKYDIIFRSPGIPYNLREFKRARDKGVKFSSGTKLFFEYYKGKVVGVTGTKGKGTVSTLIYEILKSAKKRSFLAGNIGLPAIDFLPSKKKYDVAILELSSFQLQDLDRSPSIAVVLDIFPDHLDAHENIKEYYESKKNIALHQGSGDVAFYFLDNSLSKHTASFGKGKKVGVDFKKFKLFSQGDLRIRGVHNFRNAVMAASVGKYLGVPDKEITKVVRRFAGLEHRLEFVKKLGQTSIYNDSVSTNPQTTIAAAKSFPGEQKALILGGKDKNLDYKPLGTTLKKLSEEIVVVVLCGENKNKIKTAIKNAGVEMMTAKDLKSSASAANEALRNTGGILLFSPGAASFDSFENYADRGQKFKAIVKSLK